MSYVVRPLEQERGRALLRAWSINSVDGLKERSLMIVDRDRHPDLGTSSKLVYVEGQKGSVCRNSGFLVKTGDAVVDFIEYNPR